MGVLEQFAKLTPAKRIDWLDYINSSGSTVWSHAAWPTRKTESWKYTNLRTLEQGDYFAEPGQLPADEESLRAAFNIEGLGAERLVFVNGQFSPTLSRVESLPEGVSLVTFSEAKGTQVEVIKKYLNQVVSSEQHMFAALNNQLLADGVLLHVEKNVQFDQPVHVVNLTTRAQNNFNVQQRLLVVVEQSAAATVVEHFVSSDESQNAFVNGITELYLEQNAALNHYRLNQEQEDIIHIAGVHSRQARDSRLNSFYLANGGQLKRLDVVVNYFGEGAHCEMNGVYLPRNNQHVDFHTCIEHSVPHCTTNEVFRGIIGDKARAVFNGRIHIHPDAQKTLAQLSNKNLLTSPSAEVNTKPELEIYADDVQCAHGATVAQLDATALHYLRTRGVSRKEAEVMLSFGFIYELINQIELQPVADYLRPILAHNFARDPNLLRHIV